MNPLSELYFTDQCPQCKKKIDKDDFLNCLGCGYVWDQK